MAAVLVIVSPAVFLMSLASSSWWWDGTDVEVPRDGRTHVVVLDQPGDPYAIWSDQSLVDPECVVRDRRGTDVPLRLVPRRERSVVDGPHAAKPEASYLFTAPSDGVLRVQCLDLDATPTQTLGIGRAPDRLVFELMNRATYLAGPSVLLLGVALACVTLIRRHPASAGQVGLEPVSPRS